MITITRQQLERIFGPVHTTLIDAYADRGEAALFAAGILETRRRAAYCLAQLAHEVGHKAEAVESLYFTSAARLVRLWPKRFASEAEAEGYLRDPHKLGAKVYGGRYGNDTDEDGYTYRGRGLIQLTFRDNYRTYGAATGLPLEQQPDLAADPRYVWDIAAAFFTLNKLNRFADTGDFDGLTRKINGGQIGAAARRALLTEVTAILAADEAVGDVGAAASPAPGAPPAADDRPPERAATAGPVVGPNSPSRDVVPVQELLKAKNYPVGRVDGIYGPITQAAVAALQIAHGLPKTGLVDQATLAALLSGAPRTVALDRATASRADLKRAGSRVIAETDRAATLGIVGAGISLLAILADVAGRVSAEALSLPGGAATRAVTPADLSALCDLAKGKAAILETCNALKPIADQIVSNGNQTLDTVFGPAVGPILHGLASLLPPPFAPVATLAIGIAGALLARRIGAARLDDHRRGVNLGR